MKKIYLYGNWKMNMLPFEGEEFCRTLGNKMQGDIYSSEMIQVCLFPPFLTIPEVLKSLPEDVPAACGAQDGYFEDRGAFTGEVSMDMVKAVGCSHVLVGHSERRHIFGESNEIVAKKLAKAIETGLKTVLCFGETLDERESGKTLAVVREQLESAFAGLDKDKSCCGVILAYEPVWAIGTGKNACPEDAQEVCAFAAKMAGDYFGSHPKIPVLYGGSVKESNALDLLSQHDIDGALVGGASLKVDSFLGIYENYRKISV